MAGNEVISLIAVMPPAEPTNENGFPNAPVETVRVLFANRKSVKQSEFYAAHMAGIKAELVMEVYAEEYRGERLVEYDGMRYRVVRDYRAQDSEFVDLTLTALPKGDNGYGEL